MSSRLNQEREKQLQPKRMQFAINELVDRGFKLQSDETKIIFDYKGSPVTFYPYSGWASGKTIKDGRGLQNLLKQLV